MALREELARGLKRVGAFTIGDFEVEVGAGGDSLWAIIRRPGRGGMAIRAGHATGGFRTLSKHKAEGTKLHLTAESAIGEHRFCFEASGDDLHLLRVRAWVTPQQPLLVPFLPRDLYPLDDGDDPLGAKGRVEAAQRGPNTGLIYLAIDEPAFGHVLYMQDFSGLNGWYRATGTTPVGSVGGEWPELGYLPPAPPQSHTPPINPLPAGEETAVSDAVIVLRDLAAATESEKARQFIQMLGEAYGVLYRPPFTYHEWVERAERTLKDLDKAPTATITHYGHRYIRPYNDAEYPDSMVQMTVLAAMHDYGRWKGERIQLADAFAGGMGKFFDPDLQTLRRYLPNVGDDKDANAVDSWYLYHPLRNLGWLALNGEDWARELFLKSVDFGIRAAQHFDYVWPIQYDVRDFAVITAKRGDETHGQTDVGGFYAYVMLLGFELTGEMRFLDEARAAIDAAMGMRFELEYQANLTAWGAAACLRLWRITNEDAYREQAYVYLASFLHNCEIWKSDIGVAEHYSNFFGATALHDAPYMAMYECFDSFMAFEKLLLEAGPEFDPAARMLVGEYCKYVLDRAWYYYPDAVPEKILATEWRNGHIDRKLSFPVEDLYADGQAPGQVGQEIYGAGAAFALAARAYHRIEGADFHLFVNHLVAATDRTGDRALSLQLAGGAACEAMVAVLRTGRKKLPACRITLAGGDAVRPTLEADDRIEFTVPADARLVLTWSDQ
ncbi:hypothetical protein COC42_11725 [Sphingomonas spermidinifaciens]|uniref:Uncharacterized protein n=1 Tax=Sphingomonas spermidinifaciens TaxID=1141889 RepID=A0A2A4B4W3_9SPHN|nr:hypothetical protein COC42_11725 [Sphingomonas spermidinifaciens]